MAVYVSVKALAVSAKIPGPCANMSCGHRKMIVDALVKFVVVMAYLDEQNADASVEPAPEDVEESIHVMIDQLTEDKSQIDAIIPRLPAEVQEFLASERLSLASTAVRGALLAARAYRGTTRTH